MVAKERTISANLEVLPPYNLLESFRLEKAYGNLIESFGSLITKFYVEKGFIAPEEGEHVFRDFRLGLLESGEAERMTEEWVKEPEIIHKSALKGTDGSYRVRNAFEAAATIYPKVFDQKLFLKWRSSSRIRELGLFRELDKEDLKPYMAGLIILNLFREQGLGPYSGHVLVLRDGAHFPNIENKVEEGLKGLVKRSVPYEFVAGRLNEALVERESRLFGDDDSKILCWRTLMLANLDFGVKDKWLKQILSGNIDQVIREINEMVEDNPVKIIPYWVADSLKVIERKATYLSRDLDYRRTSFRSHG